MLMKMMKKKVIAAVIPLAVLCLFVPAVEVKATEINNGVTYTDSEDSALQTYRVVIPAEVDVRDINSTENLTIEVTTKPNCNVEIQVGSINDYQLKNGGYFIDYKIPNKDKELVFSNEGSADKVQDYSIDISFSGQAVVSGEYKDQLTFVMTGKNYPSGTHKLSFDMNCSDQIYTDYKFLKENDPYGILPTPERDGYAFDGWYTAKTDGEKVSSSTTMGSEATTVYAHWTPYILTINYHNDGAESVDLNLQQETTTVGDVTFQQIEKYGTKFSNGASGLYDVWRWKRTGYGSKVNTWRIGENGTAECDDHTEYKSAEKCAEALGVLDEFKKGDVTVDLYPIWIANTYTVRYDSNSNDASGSTSESTHTYDVEKSLTSNGFSRTGYTFEGWNTKSDASGTSYEDEALVKNLTATNNATVTLYAVWKANTDTVQYNSNSDEASGSMEPSVHTYGVEQSLTLNGFTREGYSFISWNEAADGTGTSYTDGAVVKDLTAEDNGTIILYAQWEPSTYTVQYDSNCDGDVWGNMEPTVYTYGIEQNLAVNEFVRDGYSFIGWNETEDGTGEAYDDEAVVKNLTTQEDGVVTLYAQWEEDDDVFELDDELLATPNNAERMDPDVVDIVEDILEEEELEDEDIDEDEDLDKDEDDDSQVAIKPDAPETDISADEGSKQPQDDADAAGKEDDAASDTGADTSEDDKSNSGGDVTEADKDTEDTMDPSESESDTEPDGPDPEESEQETGSEEDTKDEEESVPEQETADVARSKDDFGTE